MRISDFSDMVKEELEHAKGEEERHKIASKMISIIKGHVVVLDSIKNEDAESEGICQHQ